LLLLISGGRLKFPQRAKLKRSGEFQRLKRDGVSFHGKFMLLSVLKAQPLAEARIGFITSRRVGQAVARNRVRRQLREIFRADRSCVLASYWLVVVARQRATTASFVELQAEWRVLAKRAAIFSVPIV
jgi:ribonuclease P protein component